MIDMQGMRSYPLAIEVFGCLHQQPHHFIHQCANMVWTTKGTKGPPLLLL